MLSALLLVCRRLAGGLITLWAISAFIFAATEILPGDVASAILGQSATEEMKAQIRLQLGLDQPALTRYASWLGHLVEGDPGKSLASGRQVSELIAERLGPTVVLASTGAVVILSLGIGIGLISAAYPRRTASRGGAVIGLVLISLPEYFTASVLVAIFAVQLRVLPAIVYSPDFHSFHSAFRSLALPVLTMTCAAFAHVSRMTKAALDEVLENAYIETALLKGVGRARLLFVHALPNALGPIASVVALALGYVIGGVVLVEVVFAYPGLARLMVDSVASRDMPVVQATALLFATTYIAVNILADVVGVLSNPRLRGS